MTGNAARAVHYALVVGLVLGLVSSAFAFVPEANRTLSAIARANRASGRTQAIRLELTMRIGDRDAVAAGELISHPSGLARLELRGYGGRVDRYLLSGNELLAAKDGKRLDRPQPMLQPFFLLQPATETTLRAALETFGVQSEWIGLAPCGGEEVSSEGERLAGPVLALPEDGLIPRFWVDTRELQVRRIDRKSGVFIVFGPMANFEKLQVPAWFEIHEPGAQVIRFDVDRAVQVNAPPQAFSRKWLMAPADPPSSDVTRPPAVAPAPAGARRPAAR